MAPGERPPGGSESRIYPDPPGPDAFEKRVRAAFGAVLGLFVALEIWCRCGPFGGPGTAIVVIASVAGCAAGAVLRGDAFWESFLRRWR